MCHLVYGDTYCIHHHQVPSICQLVLYILYSSSGFTPYVNCSYIHHLVLNVEYITRFQTAVSENQLLSISSQVPASYRPASVLSYCISENFVQRTACRRCSTVSTLSVRVHTPSGCFTLQVAVPDFINLEWHSAMGAVMREMPGDVKLKFKKYFTKKSVVSDLSSYQEARAELCALNPSQHWACA